MYGEENNNISNLHKISIENVGKRVSVHFVSALTLKHWEIHGCIVSTVATDTLVLKHQAISIRNAD